MKQLVDYIKKNIPKGYTPDALKWALVDQGYSRVEVNRAMEIAIHELAQTAPKLKEKPIIKYEIMDETNAPVEVKKSFWKRLFGL